MYKIFSVKNRLPLVHPGCYGGFSVEISLLCLSPFYVLFPIFTVFLDCPFLIAPLVFSNVYLLVFVSELLCIWKIFVYFM